MKNKTEIIFVILLLHLVAGILVAYWFPSAALQTCSAYAVMSLLSTLLILNTGYLKLKIYRKKPFISASIYLLLFFIGIWTALKNHDPIQSHYFTNTKTDYLQVIVDEEPQIKGPYIRFRAKIRAGYYKKNALNCSGKLMITVNNRENRNIKLHYGDEILLPARYTAIRRVKNDRDFNYAGWLATKNIFMQMYIPAREVITVGHHQGSWVKAYTLRLQKQQVDLLRQGIREPEAFAVASTLILGYRSELDKETFAAYSKTGTIHVLSVSGMHVGIIYLVLHWLLSFLNRGQVMKCVRALIIVLVIWFYAGITGFSPSVLRSALMLTCFIIAKTLNRRSNSYNVLAFSAFVLLIDDPLLIYDLGFQLSYSAVWGLLYLQPLFYQKVTIDSWIGNKLWKYLSFSLAAQIATFPLSVYYFHQFPVYFLISNLVVMLPAALIMYLGFALLLCRLNFLAATLAYLIIFTNTMLKWIAQLPYSTLSSIYLTKTELYLLFLFLGLSISCLQKLTKNRLILALTALLCLQTVVAVHKIESYQSLRKTLVKLSH